MVDKGVGAGGVAQAIPIIPAMVEQPKPDDIRERLLKDRIIFLGEPIDDTVALHLVAQMLFLQSLSHTDMTLYINSPGGSVLASFAICYAMRTSKCDIATVCIGQASGTALQILANGTPGKRFALPTAQFMFTPLMGSSPCPEPDAMWKLMKMRDEMLTDLERRTRIPAATISQAMHESRQLTAEEGRQWGLIDKVVDKKR